MKKPCEHCGSTDVHIGPPDCPRCGAPNCCETCCRKTTAELSEKQGGLSDKTNPEASQPLGTPISQLSGRPGHAGYEEFKRISASWGYD